MFLTRMPLNPARRGCKFLLASPQAMHAAVLSAFPPGTDVDGLQGRVLWRVDFQHPHVYLYIVSPEEPDLTHLVEQAGWPLASSWETVSYAPRLSRLETGEVMAFRLTANPVKQSRDPEMLGKRLPHVTAAQQRDWLLRRSEAHGFRVPIGVDGEPDVLVSRRNRHSFRRGNGMVTLVTAQFDGRLEIIDVDIFRRTLSHGLGRAKSYGCGLLTVAGVSRSG
jgi:CRISPR system Cascade subunit CasE